MLIEHGRNLIWWVASIDEPLDQFLCRMCRHVNIIAFLLSAVNLPTVNIRGPTLPSSCQGR